MSVDQSTDLPLFAWQPATQILTFPMNRRIGKIRRTAQVMAKQPTPRARKSYYSRIDLALGEQMLRTGVKPSTINAERDAFWKAVADQMCLDARSETVR